MRESLFPFISIFLGTVSETVFRTISPNAGKETVEAPNVARDAAKTATKVEVPYMDYQQENARPYIVDHYQIGDRWQDPDGGFEKEVTIIEEFISGLIKRGELENSTKAVADKIKSIEKISGVAKDGRAIIKIATVAAYMNFLNETSDLRSKISKYGNPK